MPNSLTLPVLGEVPTLLILIITLVITSTIAFCIGWNLGVWRWRERSALLAAQYDDMAKKWQEMADAMERDPMRAGLNTGQDFILREIQGFINQHNERLGNQK
jgi:hypothetical protein